MQYEVVMLSWGRPEQAVKLCLRYAESERCSRVQVWNENPDVRLADHGKANPKLLVVDASPGLSLFRRFAGAALAATPCVLVVDDDLDMTPSQADTLASLWAADPAVVHGVRGRRCGESYTYRDAPPGPVDVVLTQAAALSPKLAAATLYFGQPVLQDLPGHPRGNGEDITMSYVAMRLSGRPNQLTAIRPPLRSADVAAVSGWPGHFRHRNAVLQRCRELICPQWREVMRA
jgi:Glycosyl transferase family 64 domain